MHVPIAASLLNIMRETFVSALQTAEKQKGAEEGGGYCILAFFSTPQYILPYSKQ